MRLLRLPLLARQRRCRRSSREATSGAPPRDPDARRQVARPVLLRHRGVDPGGDRGDPDQDGDARCTKRTGLEEPVPGRRRRAELGRQLQDPARRGRSRRSTSSPRRATTAAASARRYWAYHHVLGKPRGPALDHAYLGSEYSDARDRATSCASTTSPSTHIDDDERFYELRRATTSSTGKVCGWFRGRFEWGPRALGARSIIADPRRAEMKENRQREDQVPRGVPAVRAVRARASARRVLRAARTPRRTSPRASCCTSCRCARTSATVHPGDHARRRLGPPADRSSRRPTPATTA